MATFIVDMEFGRDAGALKRQEKCRHELHHLGSVARRTQQKGGRKFFQLIEFCGIGRRALQETGEETGINVGGEIGSRVQPFNRIDRRRIPFRLAEQKMPEHFPTR